MVKFRPGIRIEVFVARPFFQRAAVTTNEKTRRKRGEKKSTSVIFIAIVHDARLKTCWDIAKYNGCWPACVGMKILRRSDVPVVRQRRTCTPTIAEFSIFQEIFI